MKSLLVISFGSWYKKSIKYTTVQTRALFLLLLSLPIVLGSCSKALDRSPTDFVQVSEFYKSKTDLISALAAVYSPLATNAMYGEFIGIQSQGCTEEGAYSGGVLGNAFSFHNNIDYTNPKLNAYWVACYKGIENANLLIANQKNATNVDATTLNEIVGEAKFLRAWYHFLLVQNFGDIPLKLTPSTDPNNVSIPRTPSKEVYAQIIKDMTEAEAVLYLPNHPELAGASSRVSKTTAQGILARVCLFMAGYPINDHSQYANALMWAKKVQTTGAGIHRLTTMADTVANVTNLVGMKLSYPAINGNPAYSNNGYAQVFVWEAQGIYNVKETMWEADTRDQTYGSVQVYGYIGSQLGINNPGDYAIGRCVSTLNCQQYLYNMYGAGDLRRDWNISPYTYTGTVTSTVRTFYIGTPGTTAQLLYSRQPGKFRREYEPVSGGNANKNQWETAVKFPLLRYSDVLLMLAEAEFMVNGPTPTALNAINQVRRRGYGLDPNTPSAVADFTSITLNDIQNERVRELAFEALRANDLRRWGIYLQRAQEVLNFNNTSGFPTGNRTVANQGFINTIAGGNKFLFWGIPSSEILVNKAITQNPGW